MDEIQFDDLKQFIVATISQSEVRLREEISSAVSGSEVRLREEISSAVSGSEVRLREEMHSGFEGVGEAIESINDRLDKRDTEFEQRLTRLEHKIA